MSRNADFLDNASELAQKLADAGVKAVQQRNRPEQLRNADGTWPITDCVDCEIEIPEGRLNMGRIRCRDCQEIKEKKSVR